MSGLLRLTSIKQHWRRRTTASSSTEFDGMPKQRPNEGGPASVRALEGGREVRKADDEGDGA